MKGKLSLNIFLVEELFPDPNRTLDLTLRMVFMLIITPSLISKHLNRRERVMTALKHRVGTFNVT